MGVSPVVLVHPGSATKHAGLSPPSSSISGSRACDNYTAVRPRRVSVGRRSRTATAAGGRRPGKTGPSVLPAALPLPKAGSSLAASAAATHPASDVGQSIGPASAASGPPAPIQIALPRSAVAGPDAVEPSPGPAGRLRSCGPNSRPARPLPQHHPVHLPPFPRACHARSSPSHGLLSVRRSILSAGA